MSPFSVSPFALNALFQERSDPSWDGFCVLERLQLIWGKDGEAEKTRTVLLTFKPGQIEKPDLVSELCHAITSDVEDLNDEYDRDAQKLHDVLRGRAEDDRLDFASVYMDGDLRVDTFYMLTTETGRTHSLFAMRGDLFNEISDEIEIGVRKAVSPAVRRERQMPVLLCRSRNA